MRGPPQRPRRPDFPHRYPHAPLVNIDRHPRHVGITPDHGGAVISRSLDPRRACGEKSCRADRSMRVAKLDSAWPSTASLCSLSYNGSRATLATLELSPTPAAARANSVETSRRWRTPARNGCWCQRRLTQRRILPIPVGQLGVMTCPVSNDGYPRSA